MNILVCTNRNYIAPLKTMLHSLFTNNNGNQIKIYLLHSELTSEHLSELDEVIKKYGSSFYYYEVDKKCGQLSKVSDIFPAEAFYRLFAPDYLPSEIKKILYLDCDIIVNGSLDRLYNIPLTITDGGQSYLFAAAPDYVETYPKNSSFFKGTRKRAGLLDNYQYKYINSGVLLINTEMLKLTITTDMLIKIIFELRELLRYPDQDLINIMFHKYITYIDYARYNIGPVVYPHFGAISEGNPAIVHYIGSPKPWQNDFPTDTVFRAEAKALYEKYASMC